LACLFHWYIGTAVPYGAGEANDLFVDLFTPDTTPDYDLCSMQLNAGSLTISQLVDWHAAKVVQASALLI